MYNVQVRFSNGVLRYTINFGAGIKSPKEAKDAYRKYCSRLNMPVEPITIRKVRKS